MPDQATPNATNTLADMLLTSEAVQRVLSRLTPREYAALTQVLASGGKILATLLEQEFGSVRLYSQYHNTRSFLLALNDPPSPTERLFLLGLIQMTGQAHQRMYYIPRDLLSLLPPGPTHDTSLYLEPAATPPQVTPANLWGLDYNLVTMLELAHAGNLALTTERGMNKASMLKLAKRWGMHKDDLRGLTYERHWSYVYFLRLILQSAGLLRITVDDTLSTTSAVIPWLQLPRIERLRRLLDGWRQSEWDELTYRLGIEIQGYAPKRNLTATHQAILDILAAIPPYIWITWDALLAEVKRAQPYFARPDGRFDTWKLVDYRRQNLDGFENWHRVEGKLLMATLSSSLAWLGLIDIGAAPDEGDTIVSTAFRLNELGAALLDRGPAPAEPSYDPPVIQATYEIIIPPHASAFARFQISQVANWISGTDQTEATVYKLTRQSVQQAVARGSGIDEVISLLEHMTGMPLPQNVAYSMHEWSGQYGQFRLRRGAILQTDDPLRLEQIRHDRRLALPPLEPLNDTTWLLSEGDAATLADALRKCGYSLAGDITTTGPALKERDITLLVAGLEFFVQACADLQLESDVSAAMLQRVRGLLDTRQRAKAVQIAQETLQQLQARLDKT